MGLKVVIYDANREVFTSVSGYFIYTGNKNIKYITIYFTAYNRVGDSVDGLGLKCTGPYETGRAYSYPDDNMNWLDHKDTWYDKTITSVNVTGADIQFMDGSEETVSGSQIEVQKNSCYVATAVYGSYDCPQVWTLRRYRDYTLAETWYGRAFIRLYYAVSPTLVKRFGHMEWSKKMWKPKLDKMVEKLNRNGVANTPYEDKNW